MDMHQLTRSLMAKNDAKIVMLVADGLGGLPMTPGGKTELETAATPNMDRLAKIGVQGASIPVKPGIAPGSGPGHLGLFGYDPLEYQIGRGALEATGIGFELKPGDVAIRCNFCTIDAAGNISDRRAGRIAGRRGRPGRDLRAGADWRGLVGRDVRQLPAAERRRTDADVHHHVVKRAATAAHQLGLGMGRRLKVQAPQRTHASRHRMIVLHPVDVETCFRHPLARPALTEEAARVPEPFRLQDDHALKLGRLYQHRTSNPCFIAAFP